MGKYASATTISADLSRNEIESTLKRYGATAFAYGTMLEFARIEFVANERRIRFQLSLPQESDRAVRLTPTGQRRTPAQVQTVLAQETRQKWRALLLIVKAKLEAVEAEIVTFEDEFLAHTVLPNGGTVGEQIQPAITDAYVSGRVGSLLQIAGN
jgi:hypothetical protein